MQLFYSNGSRTIKSLKQKSTEVLELEGSAVKAETNLKAEVVNEKQAQ